MQDKQTINTYNLKAKEYDSETSEFWDQFPRTFLNKFVELSGRKIINIGSGPGRDGRAWAYTSLLHTPKKNIDTPLKEICRVLKDQGIFALGLIDGDGEKYKTSSAVDTPRLFSFYKKDEVIEICKKNGFELLYFEEFKPRSNNYLNFIFKRK